MSLTLLKWHRPDMVGMAQILPKPDKAQFGFRDNPIYQYDTDRMKNVHRLDDMFNNRIVLNRFMFVELYALMTASCVKDIGPCFGKNAQTRTSVHFDKSTGRLTINGTKTYSRRSESKDRTLPALWLAKRLDWFLSQSLFVESFEKSPIDTRKQIFTFDIKFKNCYTPERELLIKRQNALRWKTKLEFEQNRIEWALNEIQANPENFVEYLEKRLDEVKEAVKIHKETLKLK